MAARRPRVNPESVERALNNAIRNKWITRWQRHPEGGHTVCIRKIGPVRFITNQETNAFALGLAAVDRNRIPVGLSSKEASEAIYEFTADVHAAMREEEK